jgi:uncharacterized protein YbjT (DUF2867 family)
MTTPERRALVAGATGLIGRALLPLLHASPHYANLQVLVRRAAPGIVEDARMRVHVVDFDALPPTLPAIDDVYIALGTTIKVAGSRANFRRVDFDAVVSTARAARAGGATRLAVVSALGADASSRVFYNRVKGEMQAAVSLLLCDREALGHPARPGEAWAARLFGPVMWMLPRGVRPIAANTVAAAMVTAVLAGAPGVQVLSSGRMLAAAAQ